MAVIGGLMLTTAMMASLPPSQLVIATQVAGDGLPHCTSYLPDGSKRACLPLFTVRQSRMVNARTDGAQIEFTSAAIQRLTRNEFALLAGHEIAHYLLGRHSSGPQDELEADRMGAQLACRAGYNPTAGLTLFRFLRAGRNHPGPAYRRTVALAVACTGVGPKLDLQSSAQPTLKFLAPAFSERDREGRMRLQRLQQHTQIQSHIPRYGSEKPAGSER